NIRSPDYIAKRRATFWARKHRELTTSIRAVRRAERKSGHAEACASFSVASQAERAAAVDLLTTRPATQAESDAKRRHLLRSLPFRESWWAIDGAPGFMKQIIEGSCEVAEQ